jgi:ketosteroid isomerase-like protein
MDDEDLIALERRGWDALSNGTGVEFYAGLMTDDALFVVPGMVLGRNATLQSWEGVDP